MTMGPAGIFIWRVRLCLILTAVGLVFVNTGGKSGPAKQERMLSPVSAKCPLPASRNSAAPQGPGTRPTSPAEPDKRCDQIPAQTVIRTGGGQKLKPDVGSHRLGALRGG
jgi:hypothetical protein